jgi:NAD(P)-dependent dehydrogenase (short-subunit alcohol dehydrogenase family)
MAATGRLTDRVAIITGGATGIGRAIAERFVNEGAQVCIGQLGADGFTHIPEAQMAELDVRNAQAVEGFITRTVDHFGRIDIVVSNAAITGPAAIAPLLEHPPELFKDILATNLLGPFLVAQAAARRMRDQGTGGRIINIASVDAFIAEEFAAGYVAAKSGLVGLTRACAVELAPDKITVNAIAPGQILTEAGLGGAELRDTHRTLRYHHYREPPLGASGAPEDIAGAAVYLASDEARWITGTTLIIDGGLLAT